MYDDRSWYERARDFLTGRQRAYKLMKSPGFRPALEDLAKFCRANESTFHENERVQAALEGRREVWLRIQQHIHLPPDELFQLYNPTTRMNNVE